MKIQNIFKNNKKSIVAFLTTFCLMILFYLFNGIIPLGSKTVLDLDCFHQYAPMLSSLIDKITGGQSILYSTEIGLGNSFIGNIFNYLLSPFNIIAVIFGSDNIHTSIAIIIMLKISVSSFTCSYFLRKYFKSSEYNVSFFIHFLLL